MEVGKTFSASECLLSYVLHFFYYFLSKLNKQKYGCPNRINNISEIAQNTYPFVNNPILLRTSEFCNFNEYFTLLLAIGVKIKKHLTFYLSC
jgi:hypothetical protein